MRAIAVSLIQSDRRHSLAAMLEGYDCPAILVSAEYAILAYNRQYETAFGRIDVEQSPRCFAVSHGYTAPCDESGEDCPLGAARKSGHKERVLHIHQTPRGKEHVDVEMLPIYGNDGELAYFVELLRPVPLASGVNTNQELVGKSPAFNQMLAKIARVGPTEATALLLGESGTGKELAARAIHMASLRKDKPLVTLECSGLSDALFESELFGHVKGAFTGAQYNKKGLVELADGGTLFLDELGDIPLSIQVKLLRLLETGTFRPVGSVEVRTSSFRLICATHRNLLQMVNEERFRNDLYYRINVYPIHIPALRERAEDIPLLSRAILDRLPGGKKLKLTASAHQALGRYRFPGNIRELRNLLNRALVMADSDAIDGDLIARCLAEDTVVDAVSGDGPEATQKADDVGDWPSLQTNEKRYVKRVLQAHGGNKEVAARVLGISPRSLYRKLQ